MDSAPSPKSWKHPSVNISRINGTLHNFRHHKINDASEYSHPRCLWAIVWILASLDCPTNQYPTTIHRSFHWILSAWNHWFRRWPLTCHSCFPWQIASWGYERRSEYSPYLQPPRTHCVHWKPHPKPWPMRFRNYPTRPSRSMLLPLVCHWALPSTTTQESSMLALAMSNHWVKPWLKIHNKICTRPQT